MHQAKAAGVSEDAPVIASFTDYEGLRLALAAAREHRDISLERLDAIAGAPSGYFAKLLGPRPVRRIGLQSLGWALGGLGIKCQVVEDIPAFELVKGRFVVRDAPHLSSATQWHARRNLAIAGSTAAPWLFTQEKAREMGKKRMMMMTEKQRKKIARKAGKASGRARRIKARKRQQEERA
jgi:hypothetical protein